MTLVTFLPVDSTPKQSIAKEQHESNKAKPTISSSDPNPGEFQQLLNAGLTQVSSKSNEVQHKWHSPVIPFDKADSQPVEIANAKLTDKHSNSNKAHQPQDSTTKVNRTKKNLDQTSGTSQLLAGAMVVSNRHNTEVHLSKRDNHSDQPSLTAESIQADNTAKASSTKVYQQLKSVTPHQAQNIEAPVQAGKINVEKGIPQTTVNRTEAEVVQSAPSMPKQEATAQKPRVNSQVSATELSQPQQVPQQVPQHVQTVDGAKVVNRAEAEVVRSSPNAPKQESASQAVRVNSQVSATELSQPQQVPQHVQTVDGAKVVNRAEAEVVRSSPNAPKQEATVQMPKDNTRTQMPTAQNAQNIAMTPVINEVVYGNLPSVTNKPFGNKVKSALNSLSNPINAQHKNNTQLNLQTENRPQEINRGKMLLSSRAFFSKNVNKNNSPNSAATPSAASPMNQTMINLLVNNHSGNQSSDIGKQGQSSISNSNVTTNQFSMPSYVDSSNLQSLNSDLSKWVMAQSSRLAFVGASSIVLTLVPEHLGRVKLTVKNDKNGHLQVKVAASNTEALNLLTDNAQSLQQQLEANGFGSVTINFGMDQQTNQGGFSDGNNAGAVGNDPVSGKTVNDQLLVQAGKNYTLQDLHQGFIAEA